jgi:hypothetical protein
VGPRPTRSGGEEGRSTGAAPSKEGRGLARMTTLGSSGNRCRRNCSSRLRPGDLHVSPFGIPPRPPARGRALRGRPTKQEIPTPCQPHPPRRGHRQQPVSRRGELLKFYYATQMERPRRSSSSSATAGSLQSGLRKVPPIRSDRVRPRAVPCHPARDPRPSNPRKPRPAPSAAPASRPSRPKRASGALDQRAWPMVRCGGKDDGSHSAFCA